MVKRIILILVVLAAIGGGIYYARFSKPHEIVLTGIVTTDDVIVSSQIQGRLEELKVKQGDLVKKGDILAVIEPEEQNADVKYYESVVQQMTAQVSQAEADLHFSEAETKSQITQAEANLASAQSQVKVAESDAENARLLFAREDDAYKKGVESQMAWDQARTGYDASKSRVESLQRQASSAEAAVGVVRANMDQIEARRSAVTSMRSQLISAQALAAKSKVQQGYTTIVAPIAGIVDVRAALQGEVVNAGQAIVTLIDQDDLWVRADVEESYITRIHEGDTLTVRLPSGDGFPAVERAGTVFYKAVDADYATQRDVGRTKHDIKTFEVRLRCDNRDRVLALGMTASVILPLDK